MRFHYLYFICFFVYFWAPASAQKAIPGKYWVVLKDKKGTPWCTCRPQEFLSARALMRRAKSGIPVTEEDLPLSPAYLRGIQTAGATLHGFSKWLNAVSVVADSATVVNLRALPFVQEVQYLGKNLSWRNPRNRPEKRRGSWANIPSAGADAPFWGYASQQNALLGVPVLHLAGHRGAGIQVVVMDGGFTNVDTMPFFDSLALQGRLFTGYDFVERDRAVFESAYHGTSVLSVMGGHLPGYFVGTAPDATYFLLKTEDTGGEFPIEEANWIAGAEWADSLGADIINASLGYTSFNDPALSHRYSQLDGRTAIGSRGATIAAAKGMIIFNSAGNEGDGPWRYIGVPADAPNVIAVGAVTPERARAAFSSVGPTADGRIKPDLVAPGDDIVTAGYSGTNLGTSSGTSLAAPMLAGAVASLWSAFPDKSASEILSAVFESADHYTTPDNDRGYGLPDVTAAWLALRGYAAANHLNNARGGMFAFDRMAGEMRLALPDLFNMNIREVRLSDLNGNTTRAQFTVKNCEITEVTLYQVADLPSGFYLVRLVHEKGAATVMALAF